MLGEWLRQRREREAEHEAARNRLYEEYQQRIEAGDPDAMETSRDFYDNSPDSWRVEVGVSLYLVVLVGSLLVLIPFFILIKHLTGG